MAQARKQKITTDVVNSLGPTGLVWDSVISGFGVRCQTQSKVYFLKYRIGKRQRWYTIGRHGSPWTVDTARREAKRLLGLIAMDTDPSTFREVAREAPTLSAVAQRFMTEHVVAKRKTRTIGSYRHLLDRIILPKLGGIRVKDITRADISRLHHALRDTPYQANRAIAVLSKIMNLAEMWGERADGTNPCRHLERFVEQKRERFLTSNELARLGVALKGAELGEYVVSSEAIAAVRLLVFSGARLNEVLTIQWDWIDFDRGEARLPDSKTGAKTLHLPPPALEVLSRFPRIHDNPFVIVGKKPGSHLVNLQKPWRVIRKRAQLQNVRLHDLRHAFASVAAASGLGLPIIGKILGHAEPSTTARYAHLSDDPVKAAAAAVGSTIAASMDGVPRAEIHKISNSNEVQ